MNRRSFFRDALLSFAAATALAKTSLALAGDDDDSDIRLKNARIYQFQLNDGEWVDAVAEADGCINVPLPSKFSGTIRVRTISENNRDDWR